MAQENPILTKTVIAGGAIEPHRFVQTSGSVATAATQKLMGVMALDTAVAADQATPVIVDGSAIIEASAAISVGDYVTATTAGKAIATTTAGNVVRGVALDEATEDGDLIEIKLVYFHHKA